MTTLEQRVSRLEGVLTNILATKADIAELKGRYRATSRVVWKSE